ncbi:MAG: 50S ribosomal protein L10 [Patescibacteria group bacterium]|nr:50S ribosomal protein L10 [Patescibacteria group bacterium]MDE2015437.1 50S ribosomal protein L10 [Patescibacteria group bacterium]MDE2226948.1 50S ribosomal protein L10 [Patescibacteria group bacterium]
MKTKVQKQEELTRGRGLLAKSDAILFTDFTKISAENLRRLRRDLKNVGGDFLVIKKRLLAILLKENGIDLDLKRFKMSIGTFFSQKGVEGASGSIYKFFSSLEVPEGGEKTMWVKHILAGYDIKNKIEINSLEIVSIGQLPPREVLLGQLLGILAAPIRSFLYILDQKSKSTASN